MFSIAPGQSLAMMVDLYELTMAQGYWKEKMEQTEAVFHLSFRKKPFGGNYAIAAGLASVISFLDNFQFSNEDIFYLKSLKSAHNTPLFIPEFLEYLKKIIFTCDVDALPEGQVVFPYEPLLRVKGPIIQCQLLESALLTLINFPTLIATKAARISLAAQGDEVIEFGLRRAQGIDGAMTATRASFIGGCTSTSNTLAGKWLNIPVRGTHAHSWVMAFDTELASFKAYADAMPEHSLFLVDTYNTLQGVRHAIEVGKSLRKIGKRLLGIRLDSGDISYLSIESRKLLDDAGFADAEIVASNELDEYLIADLKQQGAKVSVWGVGTNLVTGHPQSALDGVYKLSAIRKEGEEEWRYRLKLSESMSKISDPGILQVRRYFTKEEGNIADAICDISSDFSKGCMIIDPLDPTRKRMLANDLEIEELLLPIFREGKCIYQIPSLQESQSFCKQKLSHFDRTIKRFHNPHRYPVGMEITLYEKKLELIDQIRKRSRESSFND